MLFIQCQNLGIIFDSCLYVVTKVSITFWKLKSLWKSLIGCKMGTSLFTFAISHRLCEQCVLYTYVCVSYDLKRSLHVPHYNSIKILKLKESF